MTINAQKFTVNPGDQGYTKNDKRFVLWFGPVKLYAFGSLEDALEECGEWLEENAPGLLANEQVDEAYQIALAEGWNHDDAWDQAHIDVTSLDCGRSILSYEWGIVAEDPTREELEEIFGTEEN